MASFSGSLPAASIHGNWIENIMLIAADTDTPYDTSIFEEILLQLRDPASKHIELELSLLNGDITLPDDGVLMWNVPQETMGSLDTGLYDVLLTLEDDEENIVAIYIGSISIIE